MSEHIRIGDVAPRTQYVADGTQTVFPYPFPIFDAGDLEVRLDALVANTGFGIAGAGLSEGGAVTFTVPPAAGIRVTLRRALDVARTSDFQENGVLRANTLNDELDYQVAALQEVKEDLTTTIRLAPSEIGDLAPLPGPAERANRLLGFDAVGEVTVFDRGEPTLALPQPGAIPRTVEDKLAERLSARDFGAVGDGATDDGAALAAAMLAAAATGKVLEIGEGTFRTARPLTLLAAAGGLIMRGSLLYDGPAAQVALTIGDGGAIKTQGRAYSGLSVLRNVQSNWNNEGDIGIRIFNIDACSIEVRRAERFTIGLQLMGDQTGCEDSTLYLGRLIDNKVGLDCRTRTAQGWMNSLRFIGGHFACSQATNPTKARFGVRLSAEPGAYDLHNAHQYIGPAFELQRQGTPGTVDAIPFLIEISRTGGTAPARGLYARGIRMEACSPIVARHNGDFNDAIYEVAYVGTYGFAGCDVDYGPAVARAGGTVIPLHQAAAAIGSPRLIAGAPAIRPTAFRSGVSGGLDQVGFDGMGVLAATPQTALVPGTTTLTGAIFPGLEDIGLATDAVILPTSRAVVFVVDCRTCREFFVAADGAALRPIAMQFDAAERLLDGARTVRFSNANALWNPGATAFWWEMNVDLDELVGGFPLNRLQRVTLHPEAAYAAIGVRGGVAGAQLRSLRLYTAAHQAPPLLAGGGRAWGVREFTGRIAWDPPSIPAGAVATQDIVVAGARPGDFVGGGFTTATSLPIDAYLVASNTVRLRITNNTGGAIDLNPGTGFARAVKPLL